MSGAFYNEIDPYCAAWLRNLIDAGHIAPGVVDERSIEDIAPDELRGYTQRHSMLSDRWERIQTLEAKLAELEACRAEAERYRHLRNTPFAEITYRFDSELVRHDSDLKSACTMLDAAIDQARAQVKP